MKLVILSVAFLVVIIYFISNIFSPEADHQQGSKMGSKPDSSWIPPSLFTDRQTSGEERKMIIYGEDLIANTAYYFGPRGKVRQIANGMNCQNCHLDAGRRPWANNFATTFSNYPKFRGRSGTIEDIYKRINDCFQRSMNGQALDSNCYEIQSMYAYIRWVGQGVTKNDNPAGAGTGKAAYISRPADPVKGKAVYESICQTCHGANGEGLPAPNGVTYMYPPLWGPDSYNDGAGLYRLGPFANYIKHNMPFDRATHDNPVLTDEQAWDVAAFVNTQPRPHKDQGDDYKDLSKKPIDFPYGPYADSFSAYQHKFGPYLNMIN